MFEKFKERILNYVLKNFDKSEEVVLIIVDLTDPTADFESHHVPLELLKEDQESLVKPKL